MTSRERLPGLTTDYGAHAMSLDVRSRPEAKLCLERRLGTMRVRAERAAVDEIVDRCGGLPLALALVAARVSTHEDVSLARIAADLRHGNGILDAFTDESMDIDIRNVFEQSRRMLSVGAVYLLTMLARHTDVPITIDMAPEWRASLRSTRGRTSESWPATAC